MGREEGICRVRANDVWKNRLISWYDCVYVVSHAFRHDENLQKIAELLNEYA
jgi:hypothetical protein